ncbi:hypothetical protein LUZ61_012961 [Rhynchospora tenuis]|uniref:Homeobox domain-containing protein n=1 Tax=Rhynchospora tenuis TaxID=198213 RepID=A0AAD6F1R9_9POAL|nr:hypothetical protein LUZ61_012961 [Rhynchospora tenuis]
MDVVSAVEEFNGYNSKDLSKFLKDSDNSTLSWKAEDGSSKQIDIEKLATALPLNLIAVLLSPNDGDKDLAYVLRGARLLNTLSDVATRHARLEQVLLDDVKVLEQVMDLVFFTLIVLSHRYQGNNLDTSPIVRTTLGACVLHLLSSFLSSHWNELALVLLAHPKVERFVESAFGSLHENTRLFRRKLTQLSGEIASDKSKLPNAVKVSHFLSQQCEASLQFLLSLCQQKPFRDRVLRNKELCKNGGILSLAHTILRLRVPECFEDSAEIIASVSRYKAKILALLLQLCEAETISYLDEVAGSPKSMQLGQSVALEFLNVLKTAFRKEESKHANTYKNKNMKLPRGFLLINSLRLVDIFSDDSNFRFSFMTTTVPFMSEILATPHEEFISSWCSVNLPTIEEEANLEHDMFNAAGFATTAMSGDAITEANYACQLSLSSMHAVTYAQLRTSCIVKIIANLHIFVPNICEEHERDLFVREFHKHIIQERPTSSAADVCKNLSSLAEYVKKLIPSLINQDDVQLLRVFTDTLRGYCNLQGEENTEQTGAGELSKLPKAENMYHTEQSLLNLAAAFNSKRMDIDAKPELEKCVLETVTITRDNTKENDPNEDDRMDAPNSNSNSQDQRKKRKRNIMNDVQIKLIERALLDEPEMQRNAAALQAWADTLSSKGSEITPSQLKNWLNNRKARLARVAKETRHTSEGENPDSPSEDQLNMPSNSKPVNPSKTEPDRAILKLDHSLEHGHFVSILDRDGKEVGTGKVFQADGRWQGKSLRDSGLCLVDVTDLKVENSKEVLNPSEVTGRTFEEAATQNGGVMRVAWDVEKIVPLLN